MPRLPGRLRHLTPDRVRHDVRVRAIAVGLGWIPPRTMHSRAEAQLLTSLAGKCRLVVEIGVYEGSSAAALCAAMAPGSELHLIDPFGHHPTALPSGWGATEWASRRVVARAGRAGGPGGPAVTWHVALSEQVAATWSEQVDLVFVDGDHAEPACEMDWERWHAFVAPGGYMLFHDARDGRPGGRGLPGPTAVVDRHFRGPGAAPGWEIASEVDRTVAVARIAV
jgi:predicted O-methyltransferase YrrM